MNRTVFVIVAALILLNKCSNDDVAGAGSVTTNSFALTVTNPDGTTPIPNATIELRPSSYISDSRNRYSVADAVSDHEGRVTVENIVPGDYTILIETPNEHYALIQHRFQPSGATSHDFGAIPTDTAGSLTGTVNLDHLDQTAKITAFVYGTDKKDTIDDQGRFEFKLPGGFYHVRVDGNEPNIGSIELQATVNKKSVTDMGWQISFPFHYRTDSLAVRRIIDAAGISVRDWDETVEVFNNRIRKLHLRGYGLSSLPPEVGELSFLWTLDIGNNPLELIPEEASGLNLHTLVMDSMLVDTFPSGFEYLRTLTIINISRSSFETLPSSLASLGLAHLYAGRNRFTEVPPVVFLCSTLTTVDFSFNNIRQFPRGLSESKLHSLSLNHNEIDSVPEEIGYLRELQYLQLAFNGLRHLSDSIGSCTKLRYLKLNNNELASLPGTFGKLHSLDSIHCNDNRIAHLPLSITQLSSLETIDIRRNELCTPDPAIISWLSSVPNVPPWQSTQKQCD